MSFTEESFSVVQQFPSEPAGKGEQAEKGIEREQCDYCQERLHPPEPELETGNVSSCDIQGAPVVLRVPAVAKDSYSKTRSKRRNRKMILCSILLYIVI